MTDVIERDSAIAYAISGKVREIDGERWIRIRDVRDGLMAVPSAFPTCFAKETKSKND